MARLSNPHVGAWSLAVVLGILGCSRRDAEPTRPTEPQASAASAPSAKAAPDLVWKVPSGWKEQPARAMRKATYQVPGAAGPAEVAVFYFGVGQGGDVEANITRWVGQFKELPPSEAKRDQMEVRGYHVSTVRVARGTFSSGMPGGPQEPQKDWGMSAAVVETPEGPYFFKMTGPAATVDAEEPRFLELLQSVERGG